MKIQLALLLLLSILLSGCGTAVPMEAAPSETVDSTAVTVSSAAETVPEPTTAPTLSPEELFLQSLPEKIRQAHDLGLVEQILLEDLERPCTTAEAAGILQNIYRSKFGEDSWMLTNTVTEENAAVPATRGWYMTMMYVADAEALVGVDEAADYRSNLRELTTTHASSPLADSLLGLYDARGYVLVSDENGALNQMSAAYGDYPGASKLVSDLEDFDGDISIISYALTRFDRKTGEKVMTWDKNRCLRFNDSMSVQEVVETSLRYFHALEPKQNYIPYGEPMHYDESIITPELLARETTLPEASCSHLPAEWHGVNLTVTGQTDDMPHTYQLDVIKNAGFNYISLSFDAKYYHGRVHEIRYGKDAHPNGLNENRLKELDQLLAWCMERDIHLNLVCLFGHDWPSYANEN